MDAPGFWVSDLAEESCWAFFVANIETVHADNNNNNTAALSQNPICGIPTRIAGVLSNEAIYCSAVSKCVTWEYSAELYRRGIL